jgi:hypothetical protein
VESGRDRHKSITPAFAGHLKVVPAVAVDKTVWPQSDELAEPNAGISEEGDDELVAFSRSNVFDQVHFSP